jgi:hypothetical protein
MKSNELRHPRTVRAIPGAFGRLPIREVVK